MILEFWFGHSKCNFLGLKDGHFWQKWPFSYHKKWHFEWPNQNSKTTFIVQTFPKYGPYYFVNLSLLGAILAKFQFWWFFGLFWPFFPCKNWFFWNPFPPIKKRFLEKIKIMPSFYIIKTNEKTLGHLILDRFAIFNPT